MIDTDLFNYEDVATSATWVREIEREMTDEEEHDAHHHEHHHDDEHEHDYDHHHEHHHDEDDHHGHDHCGHPEHGEPCHCHHHHHQAGDGEAEEYGIQTMVYYRRQPFDIHKLDRFMATEWPNNIIRTKGVLYFAHHSDMSFLFEQAGVQKKLSEAGLWYATAPKEELEAMMIKEPQLARDWDPKYGDRMIKLVFIGQNLDKAGLTAALDRCLGEL